MSLINFMTNFPQRNKTEWLKNIDNTLNNNPALFYEFVSSFRRRTKNSIELEADGHHLFHPHKTAVDFTEYITLSLINPYVWFFNWFSVLGLLILSFCLWLRWSQAITRLRPSKSVGLDDTTELMLKDCWYNFISVLKLFSISAFLSEVFLPFGKKPMLTMFSKRMEWSSEQRQISILNAFSKIFGFVIPNHVSRYLNDDFFTSKSTATDPIIHFVSVTLLVHFQRPAGTSSFDVSKDYGIFLHSLLFRRLNKWLRILCWSINSCDLLLD